MRYLVTGGAGFIGSHLADELTSRGHDVLIVDDLSTGRRENVEHLLGFERVRLVEASVSDADLMDDCLRAVDVCVHLASVVGVQRVLRNPLETLTSQIRGTDIVMAAAARHRKRLLFASTSEVYGKGADSILGEDSDLVLGSPAKGRWSYAIGKCFGEALAHGYHEQQGLEAIVVRPFNTVGSRQTGAYGMVLPRFVHQALEGKNLTVFGNGRQKRGFTHVLDVVEAIRLLCDEDRAVGGVYNIGNPFMVTIADLAQRVIERTMSSSGMTLVPYQDAYSAGFEELGDRMPNISALCDLTGWQTTRTLDDAIDDLVRYLTPGNAVSGEPRRTALYPSGLVRAA
ncbi:MAG TPA: NAD-dependent epimerase/dehydratase family protein [Solirubrobacteraceae bacterium]|nr:NAD-dependent epimerase/dehydratase family protein [Solirubrobacteraceae bacterium]